MGQLSVVNQPGGAGVEDGPVWFEVHSMSRIDPVVMPTNPVGPFRPRSDVIQRVGYWPAQRYVVYMFTSPLGSASIDRFEVEGKTTLVVEDAGRRVIQVLERGRRFVGTPDFPLWARWLAVGLSLASVLALIAFLIYRGVTTAAAATKNE